MRLKIRYFAWVRERVGRSDEEVEVPAESRHRRRSHRLAGRPQPRTRPRLRQWRGNPRGDRPDPRKARRIARWRPRGGVLPAGHRRLSQCSISVQTAAFDLAAELAALKAGRTDIGGIAAFVGTVRDAAGGRPITAMTLEHFPGMTEAELARIEAEAHRRWPLIASRIIHRHGRLLPGDDIVLVLTASAHREAAFAAAEFLMDYLKTDAPFWKKEEFADGANDWVTAKADDDAAKARWK